MSFVDQFAKKATEPLHNDYSDSLNLQGAIEHSSNPTEARNLVSQLNEERKVEPRTYDQLKDDPQALEAYIKDAATRLSKFREQAVSARISARVGVKPDSPLRPLTEEEADLDDAVAEEAGKGAVLRYRQLESGESTQGDESLRQFLEDHYVTTSGVQKRLEEAQADVDAGKPQLPGMPANYYEENLLIEKANAARQKDFARADFDAVYGFQGGVEALVRRRSILMSEAWKRREQAMREAAHPKGRLFGIGKGKIIDQAILRGNQAKAEAYTAGDEAVAKLKNMTG